MKMNFLASVVGHGTGFNVEKLFIIQVVEGNSGTNFIYRLFSKKKKYLKIYSIPNEEIFNQVQKRTKFEIVKNNLNIIIDNKKIYEGKIKIGTDYYIDYCSEYFVFNLDGKLNIAISVCLKKKDEVVYPEFVGEIRFDISYKIENDKLEFSLTNPQISM